MAAISAPATKAFSPLPVIMMTWIASSTAKLIKERIDAF